MAIRTGKQFLDGLRSRPREVWIEGERVDNVVDHPAFASSAREIAALYDQQCDPKFIDQLTEVVEETGERCAMAFLPSSSVDELRRRREAMRIRAEASFGLMGRAPDFLNTTLQSLWESKSFFAQGGQEYADRIDAYYKMIRDQDLFLSHALVTPQNDRTKTSHEQGNLHLRVTKEVEGGIIMNGARMLATLGPLADEMLMYNLPGLKPGDEDHAVMFAIPVDTPGLRQICREPYVRGDSGKSSFDHPLSTRFEETDTLLIFHEVFVPWERIFLYRNVKLANAMYIQTAIRNHTAYQTNTRALAKMQFATGVAMAVARSTGADSFLHVQRMLGECLGYVEHIKSGLARAEAEAEISPMGTYRPSLPPQQDLRILMAKAYPRVIEILQTVAGGGIQLMPSAADFGAPELADDLALHYQGAGINSLDRIRLVKLAWDLVGEAFGQRMVQYERYYAGDPVRNEAGVYLSVDNTDYDRLVNAALALAGDPVPKPAKLSAVS